MAPQEAPKRKPKGTAKSTRGKATKLTATSAPGASQLPLDVDNDAGHDSADDDDDEDEVIHKKKAPTREKKASKKAADEIEEHSVGANDENPAKKSKTKMSKKQRAFWDGFMQKTMLPETKALQDLGKKLEAEQAADTSRFREIFRSEYNQLNPADCKDDSSLSAGPSAGDHHREISQRSKSVIAGAASLLAKYDKAAAKLSDCASRLASAPQSQINFTKAVEEVKDLQKIGADIGEKLGGRLLQPGSVGASLEDGTLGHKTELAPLFYPKTLERAKTEGSWGESAHKMEKVMKRLVAILPAEKQFAE